MRHAPRHLLRYVWPNGSSAFLLPTACVTPSLIAGCSSTSDPPDRDAEGPSSVDETTQETPKLKSKVDLPYRGVHGLNVPYPKIPIDMDQFVFKDMKSCEEIEDAVYELWDRLTMREVEAAFFSLKRLNAYPPTSLLERLSQKTIEMAEQINCRNVSSIFLSAARLKYFNPALFNCLAREAMKDEKLQDFQGVFCGTIVYAMGALQRHFARSRPPTADDAIELYFPLQLELLETMVHRILAVRDEAGLTNKNIGNFVYGLAMMKYRHEPVLNVLAEEATRVERLTIYSEQEVSNIIYSFGILNFQHERLLSHFCDVLQEPNRLEEWTEQGLSNTIYGFALLDYRPPNETMFALIWETCKEHRLQRFYNQHLMNVVFGLVTMGIKSYRVLKCLLDELLARRHKFEFMLTGLSSIVYSFANAGIYADGIKIFLQDLTSDRNLPQLTNWAITNLIQAMGKFPGDSELLPSFQKLVKEASSGERLSGFNERHFAMCLFGMSNSDLKKSLDPMHVSQIVQAASSAGMVPTYTDQGLANIVYALAHLSYIEQEIYTRLAQEATNRVHGLPGITIATLVYSWGLINYRNDAFIQAVVDKMRSPDVVQTYSEHILGNLLFGLIRLGVEDKEVYRILIERIRQTDVWEQFVYVTSPSCIEELLRTEWIDETFREALTTNLRQILAKPEIVTNDKMKL